MVNLNSWAISQISDGLLQPGSYLNPNEFTYHAAFHPSEYWTNYALNTEPSMGFSALTTTQFSNFRAAISAWDILIAPDFTQVSGSSASIMVAFTSYNMDDSAAYAYFAFPGYGSTKVSDIWLNSQDQSQSFAKGTYQFQTFLHEIGHVIGLKHPFEGMTLPPELDNRNFSVMAYDSPVASVVYNFSLSNNIISYTGSYVNDITPMVADIAAVQALYGADPNTNVGDTIYTFTQGATYRQSIYDAGGIDTLSLSSFSRKVIIDLNDGAYSSLGYYSAADQITYWQSLYPAGSSFIAASLSNVDVYTWSDNLGIAIGTQIENAVGGINDDVITGNWLNNTLSGGQGSDSLIGGDGDDTLIGGAGNDILNGGAGNDVASYASAAGAVSINLWDTLAHNTLSEGFDTLIDIESVAGSSFADILLGNAFSNTFHGGDGDDHLDGGSGFDFIYGDAGNDIIIALGDGDVIDGGSGLDVVDYDVLARSFGFSASGGVAHISGDQIGTVESIYFKDAILTFDVDSNAAFVMRLYDSVLDREPDGLGFDYWNDFMAHGGTKAQVAASFLASPEFSPSASLSNDAFVEYLYTQTLGRASDPGGKAYWVSLLTSGTTRADVLLGFSESPEHRASTQSILDKGLWTTDDNYQFVEIIYDAFGKRLPDSTGLDYWVGQLEGGASHNAVAAGFANSPEFSARTAGFTSDQLVDFMYLNSLGRASDPGGKAYWIDQINHGMTTGDLLLNFATSPEHTASLTAHLYQGVDFLV